MLLLPWLSGWRFKFKLRRVLAAGGCGRMMPEVPPQRTVPSLLLNLTLGFTKRALCLRWQDALATDLEKGGQDGLSCKEVREAGDVLAPSGTFHGTVVERPCNPSLCSSSPLSLFSSYYLSLFPTLASALIPSSQWWFCMNLPIPCPPPPQPVTGVIHHYCQGGNVCGWVQRSMTSSFEWTSLDWLFFVKDPFRK